MRNDEKTETQEIEEKIERNTSRASVSGLSWWQVALEH